MKVLARLVERPEIKGVGHFECNHINPDFGAIGYTRAEGARGLGETPNEALVDLQMVIARIRGLETHEDVIVDLL